MEISKNKELFVLNVIFNLFSPQGHRVAEKRIKVIQSENVNYIIHCKFYVHCTIAMKSSHGYNKTIDNQLFEKL